MDRRSLFALEVLLSICAESRWRESAISTRIDKRRWTKLWPIARLLLSRLNKFLFWSWICPSSFGHWEKDDWKERQVCKERNDSIDLYSSIYMYIDGIYDVEKWSDGYLNHSDDLSISSRLYNWNIVSGVLTSKHNTELTKHYPLPNIDSSLFLVARKTTIPKGRKGDCRFELWLGIQLSLLLLLLLLWLSLLLDGVFSSVAISKLFGSQMTNGLDLFEAECRGRVRQRRQFVSLWKTNKKRS